jgi:hypothetical protein
MQENIERRIEKKEGKERKKEGGYYYDSKTSIFN